MKLIKGKLVNHLNGEIYTSHFTGEVHDQYYSMEVVNLHENVTDIDLMYYIALTELKKHRQELIDGKEITMHLEWYNENNCCRVSKAEFNEKDDY